jgi:catechol 2,3-dioxygenase-like lactoylglutathione lyase family enzyme
MLSDHSATPTLAVKDLAAARGFYEDVLGLAVAEENEGGIMYTAGSGRIFVYPSSFAGTNQATAATWMLPAAAFDDEVSALREKGVSFQTFEMDMLTWDDGVASMPDGSRSAWFADPDGNILNVAAMSG